MFTKVMNTAHLLKISQQSFETLAKFHKKTTLKEFMLDKIAKKLLLIVFENFAAIIHALPVV